MKLSVFLFLLLSFNMSAISAEQQAPSAKHWLERFSQSSRQLNFTGSFVVVKNNQAEPYHWLHGVTDEGLELEVLTRLNGSRHDVLRQGNVVSYITPEQEPYSIISEEIRSPIPSIFRGNITELEDNYRFVSVGRSRVSGKVAQLIRITSKDDYRYSYWLWFDQKSGLLLKMGVLSRDGKLLEQIQFTHVEMSEQLSPHLIQLASSELPKVIPMVTPQKKQHLWQVDWLPQGFEVIKSNRHNLMTYNRGGDKTVEFMLFSDGLVDISVYVNPSNEKFREPEYANDGSTLVFNHILNGIEISVVGKIPMITAQKIAESIVPAQSVNVESTLTHDGKNHD